MHDGICQIETCSNMGKVFPEFAKMYFWQRLGDGKTCRKSVLGLVGFDVMICGTDVNAVLPFTFLAF
jgi:hypothetical protein